MPPQMPYGFRPPTMPPSSFPQHQPGTMPPPGSQAPLHPVQQPPTSLQPPPPQALQPPASNGDGPLFPIASSEQPPPGVRADNPMALTATCASGTGRCDVSAVPPQEHTAGCRSSSSLVGRRSSNPAGRHSSHNSRRQLHCWNSQRIINRRMHCCSSGPRLHRWRCRRKRHHPPGLTCSLCGLMNSTAW